MKSIRTKKGDNGFTSLCSKELLLKCDDLVCAIGDVDELMASITVAIVHTENEPLIEMLSVHRYYLMAISTCLALSVKRNGDNLTKVREEISPTCYKLPNDLIEVSQKSLNLLEKQKGNANGWLTFDTSKSAAFINLSRTVCRRAERSIVKLKTTRYNIDKNIFIYMNILSDILFTLASLEENSPT